MVIQDDVAYAHLAAFTGEGFRLGASYLLDGATIEYLKGRARCLDWGGAAGLDDSGDDGLARYKRGWATERRVAYYLGAVLDRAA